MNEDESHLRILSICYYVLAGMSALASCFFLIYVFLGYAMVSGKMNSGPNAPPGPPPEMGYMFMVIGFVMILGGLGFAGLLAFAGRSLAMHRNRIFCMIVAGIACFFCNPLGTVLGVFTFIVLMRNSVQLLFASAAEAGDPSRSTSDRDDRY